MPASNLWVCKTDNDTLVFDPDVQGADRDYVRLWNSGTQAYDRYRKEVLRAWVKKSDKEAETQAKAAYVVWLKSIGAAKREALLPSKEVSWEELMDSLVNEFRDESPLNEQGIPWQLVENHDHFLLAWGRPFAGLRMGAVSRKYRATKCPSCERELDNLGNIECVACGQPVCKCGACGCV